MNLDDILKQEAELQAKLAEMQAEKAKYYTYLNDWDAAIAEDEARKPLIIHVLKFENPHLTLKASRYDSGYVNVVRTAPSRSHHYDTHEDVIKVEDWKELKTSLLANNWQIENPFAEQTDNYKPPVPVTIAVHRSVFVVTFRPRTPIYHFSEIPGAKYDASFGGYSIPLIEGWRVLEASKNYDAVDWQDDSLEIATEQAIKRHSLDVIAQKEKPDADIISPKGLKLYDYQAVSVEFAEANGGTALIGHDMGLGKTPIGLLVADRMMKRGEGDMVLIVAPASLIPNWRAQIFKWLGNVSTYHLKGETPTSADVALLVAKKFNYYLISYDALSAVTKFKETVEINDAGEKIKTPAHTKQLWVEILNLVGFDMILIDEIHYIRNIDSHRSRAVRELTGKRRMGLSGTSLVNRPTDLWPILKFLSPDSVDGYETFVRNYTVDGKVARNITHLREMLKPIMFRKKHSEVFKELPPINRITREYELTSSGRKAYTAVENDLWLDLDDWDGDESNSKLINGILAKLMKMKQVCAWDKIDYTVELANELHEQSEEGKGKVIIFTQFVNSPEVVKTLVNKLNTAAIASRYPMEAVAVTGEHSPVERQKIVEQFQTDPNLNFLVASIQAVGEGLDITKAYNVIFHDFRWTPKDHAQAEGRAYGRISDMHSINSYYVVTTDTIEQTIQGILAQKLATFNAIIEGAEMSRVDQSIAIEVIKMLKSGRRK